MVRILVADDHPVFREALISLLEKYSDFQIAGGAATGTEVVSRVAEFKPDIVVMDILMDGVDGIQGARMLRQKFPRVKVLILTASESEDAVCRAVNAGASGCVVGTVGITELIQSIRLVAGSGAVPSSSIAVRLLPGFRPERGSQSILRNLSPRETVILQMAADGASNKEIAGQCLISEATVKSHFKNILGKLSARNRTAAVAKATARGLVKETT